ncbi:MAG: biotin/lipoyl-containing protein, partial [Myxococcales bacterium]
MATQEVTVPDIGDFKDVPVIQVFVKPGDEVKKEDPLVSLESDKATMDVPSPADGKVKEVKLKVGDKVSKGSAILVLETAEAGPSKEAPAPSPAAAPAKKAPESAAQRPTQPQEPAKPAPAARPSAPAPAAGPTYRGQVDVEGAMLVIGSGPGGYSAAVRSADIGMKTVLVERYPTLGGVCLNVGCIPSKALLHVARVIAEGEEAAEQGVKFGEPEIDLDGVRAFKQRTVERLTGGLAQMAKGRNVRVVQGTARFTGPHTLDVDGAQLAFEHAIVAAGSLPVMLPGLPEDPRIVDSTGALELEDVP